MIVLNLIQGSDEWLQARAGVITASRFSDARSKVGGLDEKQQAYVDAIKGGQSAKEAMLAAGYKAAPKAAAIEKALRGESTSEPSDKATKYAWTLAMERIAGKPLDDTFSTWQMKRGQELEPQARIAYEGRFPCMVEESGLVLTEDRLFGYSTDGFVDDDGMVEIKCPAACDKLGAIWTDPAHAADEYIDQINGGLWITGRKWCDLIVYCPWLEPVGKELFVKRITRDENAIEALEADLVEFSRLVSKYEELLRKEAA
jgi:hypothetical protein